MFASAPGLIAADIRKWTGDFCPIRNVAKFAARLRQSLNSSWVTLRVNKEEIETIPDVEVTISSLLLNVAQTELKDWPSLAPYFATFLIGKKNHLFTFLYQQQ